MRHIKEWIPCDVCARSTKPGRLWLGGADWLECPQCEGLAKVERVTEVVQARTQERFKARAGGGLSKTVRIIHPHGGSWEVGARGEVLRTEML